MTADSPSPFYWISLFKTLAPTPILLGLWSVWQAREKRKAAEAAGSHFIVTDGVEKNGYRWSKLTLKSWTNVEMRLTKAQLYWPPFTGMYLLSGDEIFDPNSIKDIARSSQNLERKGVRTLSPDKSFSITCIIKLNSWTRFSGLWRSRARIKVIAETIDAQASRKTLKLRSPRVDWRKPPQE